MRRRQTTSSGRLRGTQLPLIIEPGLLDRAGDHLAPLARDGRLIVISEEIVWAAQGPRFLAGLDDIQAEPIILPPGEGTKSWAQLAALVERLLEAGVERADHVVAFGGGVIGDLVGFATAILKRGCNIVQVPTSLLAQVDSSVGGKTAINTPTGKNLVGAFHQPSLVLIDPSCLDTLPPRHLRAGYAEVVKCGLIGDIDFFTWCEWNGKKLFAGDAEARVYAIGRALPSRQRSSPRTNGRHPAGAPCSISGTRSPMLWRRRPVFRTSSCMARRWRWAWSWPSASPLQMGFAPLWTRPA